jgi:uncharacterized membrane protein
MFWLTVISYWLHLMATVVWLGGLALWGVVGMPAFSAKTLTANQWLVLQKRFLPYANASLVILLVTGFIQMTTDPNYNGFLQVDSLWAGAILVKHIAFAGMVAISVYMQGRIYPAMERALLLMQKKENLGLAEQTQLEKQEKRLLWLNLVCAVSVLFFTAVATAV